MKITRAVIASLVVALVIPFANTHAADPIISINTLDQLTTFAIAAGNFRLDSDITLIGNIAFKEGFNFDLNGHTLDAGANVISISGTVKIKDSSSSKTGKITGKNKQLFQVNANRELTIESGTIESTNLYAIYALTNAKVIINGGLVTSGSSVAIVNQGELIVNGGKVYSPSGTAIYGQTNSKQTINGGTVQTNSDDYGVLLSKPGSTLYMNGGEILATYNPGPNSGSGGVGVGAFKDTSVVMTGGTIRSHSQGLCGNGSISGKSEGTNAKFTISGGEIYSDTVGIYAPQPNGETTISGGTVSGGSVGIEVRAGKLTISGGNIIGGQSEHFVSVPNYSGTTAYNAAVAVSQHNTKLPIEVVITGGTFKADLPFAETNPMQNSADDISKISIRIENGSKAPEFISTGDTSIFSEDFEKFIYGGRYTHDIDDGYVADNHGEIIESDSMDAVYPYRKAEAAEPEHGTVEISREQTLRGIEVTINPQPALGYVVTNIDVVDSEGNHIPVVNNKYLAPNSDTTVTVTFGTPNPATGDDVFDYGAFMGLCGAGLVFAISGIRLARTLRRVL